MKTRCPHCLTTFRVTPNQLKVRVGKVRCGQCQTVFNALDSLLEEGVSVPSSLQQVLSQSVLSESDSVPANEPSSLAAVVQSGSIPPISLGASIDAEDMQPVTEEYPAKIHEEKVQALSQAAAQALGKATGLILPRETTEIPGYSKWVEGVMTTPISLPVEKNPDRHFVLVALLLVLVLSGQLVFHFRSEIATTLPSLRLVLDGLSQALGTTLPLPRHVELVSIEASDLQTDQARGNLLILNATLRNRANYGQAYPSLELSLTDTRDTAIARRIFSPSEYLSPKVFEQPFAANSDVVVRLWIEAQDITAAGYRLYVFYP